MNGRSRIRALLLLGAMMASALALAPAPAAGGSFCEILGNVTLTTVENLAFVDGGTGTLQPSPIVCVGTPINGSGTISGNFAFCKHINSTTHGNTAASVNKCQVVDFDGDGSLTDEPPPMANQPEENIYNGLGASPIIAHVVASFAFTMSGQNCSFNLNGHTIGVQANLELRTFKCGTTLYPTARAEALAAFVVDPTRTCPGGQPQLCFQNVVFEGVQLMAQ